MTQKKDADAEDEAEGAEPPESPLPVDIEKTLRQEILEAQKSHDEFHKWKLIVATSLVAIALGIGRAVGGPVGMAAPPAGHPVALSIVLLAALPAVCLYVDHRVMHVVTRMIVIGSYIRVVRAKESAASSAGHDYESFVHELRDKRLIGRLLFGPVLEYISTYLMCLLTVGVASAVWVWNYQCTTEFVGLGACAAAAASGVLSGIILTLFILLHKHDVGAITRHAENRLNGGVRTADAQPTDGVSNGKAPSR